MISILRDVGLRTRAAIALTLPGVLAGGIAPAPAAERYERGLLWRISEESGGEGVEAKRLRAVVAHRLLEERNVRMAERSEARLREGGAFIAVGALHLYGDAGMLSLLERCGWRVTRVY